MDASPITGRLKVRSPFPGHRCVLIHLEYGFFPFCLMRLLTAQVLKSIITNDGFSLEMLELSSICPGLSSEVNKILGTLQLTIMVRCDICNEVGGVTGPHPSSLNVNI